MMNWNDPDGWLTRGLSPKISTIIITLIITFCVPLIIHILLYHVKPSKHLPQFLIIGPNGSGKTTLLSLLASGKAHATHTSQTAFSINVPLPKNFIAKSSQYDSVNTSLLDRQEVTLTDTPGHPKLRNVALESLNQLLTDQNSFFGIIFVINAATMDSKDESREQAVKYLLDILLLISNRHNHSRAFNPWSLVWITNLLLKLFRKSVSRNSSIPLLILANKSDLFTAISETQVVNLLRSDVKNLWTAYQRDIETVGKVDESFYSQISESDLSTGLIDRMSDEGEFSAKNADKNGLLTSSLLAPLFYADNKVENSDNTAQTEKFPVTITYASSSIANKSLSCVWEWISYQF